MPPPKLPAIRGAPVKPAGIECPADLPHVPKLPCSIGANFPYGMLVFHTEYLYFPPPIPHIYYNLYLVRDYRVAPINWHACQLLGPFYLSDIFCFPGENWSLGKSDFPFFGLSVYQTRLEKVQFGFPQLRKVRFYRLSAKCLKNGDFWI